MNILVAIPKFVQHSGQYYDFPLGLPYISTILKKSGYQVHCINLNHHFSCNVLKEVIEQFNIDILCTGGISIHYMKIKEIFDVVHKFYPDLITVLGGGLITSEPKTAYELIKPTYGVIGEGEETILELINAISNENELNKIKGIIYRDKLNNVFMTPERTSIADIDQIPFPDFEGFEVGKYLDSQMPNDIYYFHCLDKKPRALPIISSRGCPFQCTFCFHPVGKKYRQRSSDNFFSELETLIDKYHINYACVYDELFSVDKDKVYEFCTRIKRYKINWMTQMRVNNVDEEILQWLKEAGATCISYGIESGSNEVLKSMKKAIKIEQVDRALELTKKNRITIQGNLIFGDSAETYETVQETLKWFERNKEYAISMGLIDTYPGSALYCRALKNGIIKDKEAFIQKGGAILNHTKMPDKEFSRLFLLSETKNLEGRLGLSGKVVSIQRSLKNKIKGDIYSIKSICPHCRNLNEYKQFNIMDINYGKGIVLICRKCYQKYYFFNAFLFLSAYSLLIFYRFLLFLPFNSGVFMSDFFRKLLSLGRFTPQQNVYRIKRYLKNLGKGKLRN